MRRSRLPIVVLLAMPYAGSGAAGAPDPASPGTTLYLAGHCAAEHPHMRTAPALLEAAHGHARALVRVQAGHVVARTREEQGMTGLTIWLDRLAAHAPGPVTLSLSLGDAHSETARLVLPAPDAVHRALADPDTAGETGRVGRQLRLLARALREQGTAAIRLHLSHDDGTALTLEGPRIDASSLAEALALPRPRMRTLSLPQTLNPFQEGGLVRTLIHGARYNRCRRTRVDAIRHFDRRERERPVPGERRGTP